ncbi:DUF4870 domain-containing protein [Fimbriimonas ginsengisoli]|uniref:DUF4870 domain-containing protein n=1 Tax=Fimbriimonas ginsengisoli Gsoil 348 TaxID=661478 RepID=A0A068NVI8_FIMGI|nr:DUF4870 domain-containing protein [Fimbriimonas ginsengisoli]AIE85569.1 hypothetical protein OP10G_2201 [Fimbriimonas ginsengisoli Gsoil 348]
MISRTSTVPTQTERLVAAGMHIATIFAPLVGPAIVWALWRNSPFVSGHARRTFNGTLLLQGVLLFLGACSLIYTIWSISQTGWQNVNILALVLRWAIVWVFLIVLEWINILTALRHAYRAYRGE